MTVQDKVSSSGMTKNTETNESHKTGNTTESKLKNAQTVFVKEVQEQKTAMQKTHLAKMEKLKAKMKAQVLLAQQEMMASLKAEFSSQLTMSQKNSKTSATADPGTGQGANHP